MTESLPLEVVKVKTEKTRANKPLLMKRLLLLPLLLLLLNSNAQFTAIPDTAFEQALILLGHDIPPIDGQILTANVNSLTFLNVSLSNISSMVGIEDFTSIVTLHCNDNLINNIDVTQLSNLRTFYIEDNFLGSIDVTQNSFLENFWCDNNNISSIDVSQNLLLITFQIGGNQLTSIDVSYNDTLKVLECENNLLTCLNLKNGNPTNWSFIRATNNPNLICIDVDSISYSTANWTVVGGFIDSNMYYSTNCNNSCSLSVGVKEQKEQADVNIYPNPTSGQLSISLKESKSGSLRVLNSLGQVVLKEEFKATKELNISLDGPSGLYFIQVEVDGELFTKKVVKE